jgi:phosphoglycerate dehydrogenase-like enzyme
VSAATPGSAAPIRTPDEPLVIGLMYPEDYEARPRQELDDDVAALRAIDPAIEIIEVRYVDSTELRTQRGSSPGADLRHLSPPLTPAQRDAFSRVVVALTLDLPFDVATVAPNLRWVQGLGAGVSQLLSAGLREAGIRLTSAAGVNGVSISEFVVARLLQIWKRLPEIDALQGQHLWQPAYGREVAGSTLGLVGLGGIGRQVARRGHGLGMNVLACRRTATTGSTDPDVDAVFPTEKLHEMLGRCDAVVAAVPESAETVGLFGAAEFAAMRPGSIFVNVGRGSAVDEEALVAALGSGHMRAAVIDVVVAEPLAEDSPLWEVPNLYISSHCSTSPDRFFSNLYTLFRENVRRYIDGSPLINEMDTEIGTGIATSIGTNPDTNPDSRT